MDPLSDVIALLRPSTALAKPITGRGRWGVGYTAHDAPGFTLILQGRCWIAFDGREPTEFREGDFLLLPSTPPFTLSSHPDVKCEPQEPTSEAVRHGDQDGPADFVSLGGTFLIEEVNAPLLLALLPRLIHIPATAGRSPRLNRVIALIMEECAADEPGKAMILERLLEVLLVEALRAHDLETDVARASLLRGLRDPALAPALRAAHSDVRGSWTVAQLAKACGLSRSAFAARFGETLGCGPIEYLTRWRMALAKDALLRGQRTLEEIADDIGYESASAFSTAFRRRFGCAPGKFAHERRTLLDAGADARA